MPNTAENKDINFQPKTQGYSYSNQNSNKNLKKRSNIFFVLLIEIFGLLFLLFAFLAVLNYFNFISLKNISPQIFSWLPSVSSFGSINDISLTEDTRKIGRFVQYPLSFGTGYILSSQYPTIVAIEKDTKNNLLWVAASFDGKQLTFTTRVINASFDDKQSTSSTPSANIGNKNSTYYQFKGLTIWYAIDKNTKIYKKTPERSLPDLEYQTGIDYATKHITVGNTLFQIISQVDGGTKDKPKLNAETLKLIKNSPGKENIRTDKIFVMYAAQIFLLK